MTFNFAFRIQQIQNLERGGEGDTIDINHERITLYPIWYQKHATGFQ